MGSVNVTQGLGKGVVDREAYAIAVVVIDFV